MPEKNIKLWKFALGKIEFFMENGSDGSHRQKIWKESDHNDLFVLFLYNDLFAVFSLKKKGSEI